MAVVCIEIKKEKRETAMEKGGEEEDLDKKIRTY